MSGPFFLRRGIGITAVLGVALSAATPAEAQNVPRVNVQIAEESRPLEVRMDRGYAAFPAGSLEELGWSVAWEGPSGVLVPPGAGAARPEGEADRVEGARFVLEAGTPFFSWRGEWHQLADPPYLLGDRLWVPLQLLVEFLPRELPDSYRFDPATQTLVVLSGGEGAGIGGPPGGSPPPRAASSGAASSRAAPGEDRAAVGQAPSGPPSGKRVVVIDPGHGGSETGTIGRAGTEEKDLALEVARLVAEQLTSDPRYEVHLTREADIGVPLWLRGESATGWRGDRPGIFLSVHANASSDPSAAGVETYFLAEARTEHARRVAALENASLPGDDALSEVGDPGLALILRDLRNEDLQHWSARLAELVQAEITSTHPGPDRGVKQGPFAVLTNTLMPSALVELGFLSNPREESLLRDPGFQARVARAIVDATHLFFEEYPPGGAP